MKTRYLLTIFCLFSSLFSFAQLQEDFTDGDFLNNPAWDGEIGSWTVISGQLRSNSAVASSSFYLSTPSALVAGTQWEFYVKLSFNTSGTNYVDVYLTSESENLKTTANGYFVRIGDTRDEISLYKKVDGVSTLLINGTDGITNTSSNSLKIKVTCTADHAWNLERDVSGTGASFTSEGTLTDVSLITGEYFGVFVQQSTASFFNKHFFDNFQITPVDVIPPTLTAVQVLSANTLELTFSEPLNQLSAVNIENYTVSTAIGNPATAKLTNGVNPADATKVVLTFATGFESTQAYEITVSGVEDANNNAITVSEKKSFTYIAPFTPRFRDIVINEILADPSPVVDLPEAEFVELYNTTDQNINLTGYTFTDGSSTATFGNVNLPPKTYLIICNTANAVLLTPFGTVAGLSSFPSLNNGGETLTLKNPSGIVIDKITYATAWYQDAVKDDGGWTLEQINPTSICNNAQNWIASKDETGGTPGKQNSVFNLTPDITAPLLLSVQLISDTELQLRFSETMDSLLLKNIQAYSIDKGASILSAKAIFPDYTAVQLTLDQTPAQGDIYTITVDGLSDCPGNAMKTSVMTFGIGAIPQPYELLITEIMADETPKVGLPEAEFIELYNPTNKLLSLDKLTFSDGNGSVTLSAGVIAPGEYLILCASSAVPLFKSYGRVMSVSGFSLNNSGEPLTLTNALGKVIHAVNYSSDWYRDPIKANGGWSLEMIDIDNPCGDELNWAAAEAASGGTPGKPNSVQASKPDLTAPRLLQVLVIDSLHVSLLFDEKLDSASATITEMYSLSNNSVQAAIPIGPFFREVQVQLTAPLLKKVQYILTVKNTRDCNGNISRNLISDAFTLPEQGDSLDMIINEVLFNPRTGGADFVEIYNRSGKYINLQNWQLANWEDDSISNLKPIVKTDFIMAPHSYLVLTTNKANVLKNYPRAVAKNFLEMKSMPTYTDESGTVILLNNLNTITDRFSYSEDMHFSLIDDVEGVSLERINPDGASSNSSNWHSAASAEGYATPGYRNSQFLVIDQATSAFSIFPKVFTPDEDGWDDFTTFNYKFSMHGNVATISIFDVQGREVKKIASNQLLAAEGSYSWDGTNEQGLKVRTGAYIVYVTLFNMHGKKQTFKERVVVGAKF